MEMSNPITMRRGGVQIGAGSGCKLFTQFRGEIFVLNLIRAFKAHLGASMYYPIG
jgi:hypothetical protein